MVFTYNKGTIRSSLVCIHLCTYTNGEGEENLIFKVKLLLMYKQALSLEVRIIVYYKNCTNTGWRAPVFGDYQRKEKRGILGA